MNRDCPESSGPDTMNEREQAIEYCDKKGYIILEKRKDELIYLDRTMAKKTMPYFFFKKEA